MNQETYRKPSLDAESFQRLLAAAFILQSRLDWISRGPIRTTEAKRFPPAQLPRSEPRRSGLRYLGKALWARQMLFPSGCSGREPKHWR